ncbi:hypothetical protein [Streptomyces sp. NPDC005408]|uniref:hypothetical protein n=1 Tax=Streptomyces sp. NPDC005408 TaxID=3155341 RepID=UPI0033A277EF
MSVVTLIAPEHSAGQELDLLLLASLLRAVATPDDGLEHISVRPAPDRVDLVLFQTVAGSRGGAATGEELCHRALEAVRRLDGWTVGTVS